MAQIFESVPVDVWSYAPHIKCPVLAIRGRYSDSFPAGVAQKLATHIDDYRLQIISRAGHFVPMEQPEACARAIVEVFGEIGILTPNKGEDG